MASVSSLGSGSGLDLQGILTKLMAVEQQPLTELATKEASYQAKLSAFGSLQGALSALQTAAKTLTTASTYTAVGAGVTDSTIASATVTGTPAKGSYSIAVGQLAQAQVLRSNTAFAATDVTFNTGTIAISVGGGAAVNVTVDGSNNTLAGIRDAINAADAGVTASIVNDGTTNRLLITSTTTGLTAGAVTVAVTDSGSGGSNALSLIDGASLVQVQAPLDASFSINGLAITRSTNSVSDAIDGVTLNLTKAGTLASPLTTQLTLSPNTGLVQSAVTSFVSAYNAVVKQIKSFTTYDSANNKASLLTGDSALRSIQSQLSSLIGGSVSGLSGGLQRFSDIGVTVQKDGTLSTDLSKLQAALANGDWNVAGLFNSTASGNQGLAVRINAALDGFIGSGGLIASRTDGINASIKNLGKRRDALVLRLTKIEANYRAQFTALDTMLASMQRTQSYLSQQLDYIKSIATGVSSSSSSSK